MAKGQGLNPGEFKLVTLGTGTGIPGPRRPPGHLVVAGDLAIILDTGPGTLWQAHDAGVGLNDIDLVLYSHLHPDHFSGFVPLLFGCRSPQFGRKNPLLIAGPTGISKAYEGLKAVFGEWIELPPGLLTLRELSLQGPDGLTLGGLEVKSLPVEHTDALGFRLSFGGRSIAFSGDTGYSKNLVALARDADLFLCECAFPDRQPVDMHMTPTEAGRAAGDARVKKLVLTHLYPVVDPKEAQMIAGKESGVETVVAGDLDVFVV